MDRLFITSIEIEHVRHLSGITIDVAQEDGAFRHVIFTGKNGSGKTSLLDAIAGHIDAYTQQLTPVELANTRDSAEINLSHAKTEVETYERQNDLNAWESRLAEAKHGVDISFNVDPASIRGRFERGECVFAYFKAQRAFAAQEARAIEKIEFKDKYGIYDSPRDLFVKYLLDMKMTQALASSNGNHERAAEIAQWFDGLQGVLREIYEDRSLSIEFDEETFGFSIREDGREPFDFNSASDGFSAVLDIIVSLMLRMHKESGRSWDLRVPGIAIIDEIENHLHLSLQKRIMPYLVRLFPNIQFIVSTHSPFVLSSIENAVVYDLENGTLIEDGLSDNSYNSIVTGYFNVDALSSQLREKYKRYKELAASAELNDDDLIELAELEIYLDEIPDYLELGITTEYKKLKLQLHRGELNR